MAASSITKNFIIAGCRRMEAGLGTALIPLAIKANETMRKNARIEKEKYALLGDGICREKEKLFRRQRGACHTGCGGIVSSVSDHFDDRL